MASRPSAQQMKFENLQARLNTGFWRSALGRNLVEAAPPPTPPAARVPPTPFSPMPKMKLLASPSIRLDLLPPINSADLRFQGSNLRVSSPGHIGALRDMRRRQVLQPLEQVSDLWLQTSSQATLPSKCLWQRKATLFPPAAAAVESLREDMHIPRNSPTDVRKRRSRRPADFGVDQRCQSCVNVVQDSNISTLTGEARSQLTRCDSVPASGTVKADAIAELRAKMKAVAALQQLFFEEMANGSTDANHAAARALKRLTEAPLETTSSSPDERSNALSASRSAVELDLSN